MSETSFQSRALKYLNEIPGCCAENVSGNAQQSGRADINGVYFGKSFRIELKVLDRGNKPTKKQFINLIKWFKSGSAICVAYTMTDIKQFIKNMDSNAAWERTYKNKCKSFGMYMELELTNEFFRQYKKLYIQN